MLIDVQQPSVKPLEAAPDLVIRELPSVHFQKVPCGRECVADSGEIGGGGSNGEGRDGVWLRCIVTGTVELALQIRLGDLQIAKGHAPSVPSALAD